MSEGDFQSHLQDMLLKSLDLEDNMAIINEDRTSTNAVTPINESDNAAISAELNNLHSLSESSNNQSPLLDTGQMAPEDPLICPYCNKKYRKPRVLDCLHSLCQDCVIAQLDGRNKYSFTNKYQDLELEQTVSSRPPPGVVRCPVCSQETNIGNDPMFVNLMLTDFIRMRKYGITDSVDNNKICQSCKSEESAVANCINCHSHLCQKCVQAHMDMKMFDDHSVVIFSEEEKMAPPKESVGSVRTAICEKHKADFEQLCTTCDVLLCNQCTLDHLDHSCGPLNEYIYKWCKEDILKVAKQAEQKGKVTLEARSAIPEREEILNESYAKCCGKIEQAFQFYARILDNIKAELLSSLEKNKEEKQEYLNTLYQKIDKQTNLLHDALGYTSNLLEVGNVVELCLNRKKVWQQLKLLMHSMPDGNAEVDLDYEILPEQEFKSKLEALIGHIKCRVTGLPKEPKNLHALPLLGSGPSKKMDGFMNELDTMLMGQTSASADWDSPGLALAHKQPTGQGPGTIGMERRMNRNSTNGNGNNYLSGDSGIYSSASDMTIQSPISAQQQQLNASMEAFGMGARFGMADSFGSPGFRTPTHSQQRNSQEPNQQFDGGNPLFSNYFGNSGQSKAWMQGQANLFGGFDVPMVPQQQQQRPRDLMGFSIPMSEFPPLGGIGTDPSLFRSRSSLCNTPSVEPFAPNPVLSVQNYVPSAGSRFNSASQPQLEMTILHMFTSDTVNAHDTFNTPQGLALGLGNEVAIADTNNHRCVIVDLKGNIIRQIGSSGTEEGHVYYPKKIVAHIRERDCRYIILDRGTNQQFNRLQLFKNSGEYISRLALPCPIDQVSVMAWNKENEQLIIIDNKNLIMTFQFETFNQLSLIRQFSISGNVHEPSDIGVFRGQFYITDYKMHAVVVYNLEGKFVTKFGGLDTTPYPVGIDFSKTGDVLVGDSHGNHFHIVIFNIQGVPQHHYRCYQQKVSRCTGLKINSEGNILTMSRQNSSIIVFNTLYLPPPA